MTKPKNKKAIKLLQEWRKEDLYQAGLIAGERRLARALRRFMVSHSVYKYEIDDWLTTRQKRRKK